MSLTFLLATGFHSSKIFHASSQKTVPACCRTSLRWRFLAPLDQKTHEIHVMSPWRSWPWEKMKWNHFIALVWTPHLENVSRNSRLSGSNNWRIFSETVHMQLLGKHVSTSWTQSPKLLSKGFIWRWSHFFPTSRKSNACWKKPSGSTSICASKSCSPKALSELYPRFSLQAFQFGQKCHKCHHPWARYTATPQSHKQNPCFTPVYGSSPDGSASQTI